MKFLIAGTIAAVMGLVVLNGFIFIGSGAYNVAAIEPHWPLTHWIVRMIKLRSVRAHAAGISAPSSLDDDDKVTEGIVHFAAHCVICHGAPGVPNRGFGRKLYPDPPDLAGVSETYGPGELFWIVKNGIKATGMPAWNDHSDEELWAIIAFLRMLPAMSPQAYASLLTASTTRADHHHHADAVQCGNVPSTPSSSF